MRVSGDERACMTLRARICWRVAFVCRALWVCTIYCDAKAREMWVMLKLIKKFYLAASASRF